jgi:hypothetical protein
MELLSVRIDKPDDLNLSSGSPTSSRRSRTFTRRWSEPRLTSGSGSPSASPLALGSSGGRATRRSRRACHAQCPGDRRRSLLHRLPPRGLPGERAESDKAGTGGLPDLLRHGEPGGGDPRRDRAGARHSRCGRSRLAARRGDRGGRRSPPAAPPGDRLQAATRAGSAARSASSDESGEQWRPSRATRRFRLFRLLFCLHGRRCAEQVAGLTHRR